uniref:Activating signal cointegrator 1 complex subunit 2 n=1 Tax=Gadus morhua TaxID=8049 RepID=A0A8C5FRN3_GADMO
MACAIVPLDEQQVTEPSVVGKDRTLPALHPDRKEERCFVPYKPPPEDGSPAQVEEFLEHAKFITEDLEWLLALPHDKFWCQVVFDETLQKCLDSYLRHASRGLDPAGLPCSPAVAEAQRHIHRAVFMTFLRMATHKESKENFLTPSVFGEIIYENFLFDIPKILDLCVLFGKGNTQLLHKMIENIFTQQPGYYSDLDEAVPSVLQVFDTILDKCGLQCEGAAMEPMKLSANGRPTAMTMSQQDLLDLVLYLCDSTTTIHAFLDIYPPACSTFQSHNFLSRLVSFYESAVPDIEKAVRKRNFTDKSLKEDLWKRMCHSCKRMVEVAHLLLQHSCLQPILEGGDNIQTFAEELLQHFTSFLPEKRFLSDYDEQFPIADDISLLQQALPLIDETRTSYLLQGVQSAWDSVGRRRPRGHTQTHGRPAAQGGAAGGRASPLGLRESGEGWETPRGAEASQYTPHKGNNYGSRSFITEAALPPCVPRAPKEELPPVLSERSNVFDDDEFDVFHRDKVDMSRIWKGRRKGESAQEVLGDKQHIDAQRDRYRAYENVVDEVMVEPGAVYTLDGDYDDEYDDTYDVNQVGANDLDGDSLLSRSERIFFFPLTKNQNPNHAPRDQFCQDPALLRERAEARRAAFHQKKGFRPEPAGSVVGKPKGQGQTQETLQDRRKKEASKGRGANHNRRNMADRKRNKGMIPS